MEGGGVPHPVGNKGVEDCPTQHIHTHPPDAFLPSAKQAEEPTLFSADNNARVHHCRTAAPLVETWTIFAAT